MAAPTKPAADASGVKNARSAAGLPAAALRRFANDLEGEVPSNKFLQINRDRVSEFINKKPEQEKQDSTRSTQKCSLPIPGICDYGSVNDPPRRPLLQLQSLPEFQPSLGMRSRFGEGDGSFFDQWLNSDIIKTKHLYDKDGFPVMKFRGETQGGFKKHLSDYKAGIDDKKPVAYVPTYAERKAERLRREAEEKQKAQEAAEKATALPPLTRANTATSMLFEDSRQPDFVRLEMPPIGQHLKLPMLDSLSPADKESYFGQEARLAFFESYRQLARMRNTIGLGEEDREIEALLTARTQQIEAFEDKEELAELIHMAMDLDVCSEAGSEDAQEMGDVVDEHNRVTPFSRQPSRRAMILEDGDEAAISPLGMLSRQNTGRNAAGIPLYVEDDSKPSTARSARSGQSSPLMRKRPLLPSRSNPRIARPRSLYSRQRVDDARAVTDEEKRRLFAHIHGESLEPTPGARPLSARSRFLVGCVRKGILPQASLIIRKSVTTTLSIASFGIGNELALLFAASLPSLPMLEGLNIADNNLTDAGLVAIVKALYHCKRLQSFDISRNKVDVETAKALLQFLSADYCPLRHLLMGNANVDDNEAAKFVKVIANRRNFKELDLSENLLGSHEFTLRTQETAGKALGSLLSDPRCTLEKLNLSWNMLRFQSGIELVTALKINTSLTYLDLSFNRLCGEGGDALGNALHANRTLKVLKLAHNDITSRPCCTILSGVVSCESLTEVDLSKNPIGELGARLLLAIDLKCGERVKVDIRNCQLRVHDNSCWFDPVKPRKDYTLRLSDPYERCVCIELLRLVSGPSSEYAIETYQFKGPDDTEFRDLPLDIYTSKSGDGSDTVCISPREAELKIEAARNTVKETANRIFRQYDTDGSGALDRHELATILDQIGMEGSQMMVNQLMSIYDTDGSGMVEEEEFVAFLMDIKSSSVESADVAAVDRFVYVKDEAAENSVSHGGKPELYFPPEAGVVHLKLNTDSTKEISPQHISRRSVETMLDATKSSEDRSAIFEYALSVMRLQFSDAQTFYRVMLKELGSAHQVLVRLIPRMATPNDARLLITYVTNNDFEFLHMLRQSLGPLYAIYIGLPNGYYRLNLAEEADQRCLKALVELSNSNAAQRKRVGLGDTSQDGNWMGFRNTVYEGKTLILTHDWLDNLPEKGRLEFDFININQVNMSEMEISHLRLFRVMQGLGMVTEEKRRRIFDKLTMDREEGRTVSKGSGYRPHSEMKTTTMEQAANFLHTLYATYATSRPTVAEQPIGEVERQFLHPTSGTAMGTAVPTAFNTRSPTPAATSPRGTPKNGANAGAFPPTPKGGASQQGGVANSLSKAREAPKDNSTAAVPNDSHGSFVKDMMESGLVDPSVIAERLLETLKFALAGRFITCIQLALLVEKFPDGFLSCGAFSTFRTELVISLYSRVLDPINFDYVLKDLEGSEVAILLFRLGWLNIWNPIKAEGRTILDLSRREERQVLRMLLILNFAEPGPSWQDPSYRRSRNNPPEENWSLPASWYTESTLPTSGILSLKYFSGMSCGQDDCAPNPACRHTLMALVLAKSYAADVWSGNKANLDSVANMVSKMGCKLYFTTEAQLQNAKGGHGR